MPYLSIAVNHPIPAASQALFLAEASQAMAAGTGKPEQYVLVKILPPHPILFAATDAPAAFLEVKSIGYPAHGVKSLAQSLSGLVTRHLGVPGGRIYIVFEDVKGAMWSLDGETFG